MNGLKRRIERLEQATGGTDRDVVLLRRFAGERLTAISANGETVQRLRGESEEGLIGRVEAGLSRPFNIIREIRE